MNKGRFIEAIDTSNLSDQTKFRLNEIHKIMTILILKSKKEES